MVPFSQIQLLHEICSSSCGAVYKATWLENDVAVKLFTDASKHTNVLSLMAYAELTLLIIGHEKQLYIRSANHDTAQTSQYCSVHGGLHQIAQFLHHNGGLLYLSKLMCSMHYLKNLMVVYGIGKHTRCYTQ